MEPVPMENQPNEEPGRRKRVLAVDADPGLCWSLEKGLGLSGYDVQVLHDAESLIGNPAIAWADCVLLELLPEAGLTQEVLSTVLSTPGAPPVICTSAEPNPDVVIECMRRGAVDLLAKPFSLAEIRRSLATILERAQAAANHRAERPEIESPSTSCLVGMSAAIQDLRTSIRQVAQTDLNCLIRGESGAGKDMVAREIHRFSKRSDKPYIKVNCTALPENLLESELFGYEKGAFTGATAAKPGRFVLAHEGIIFLDEIGDMHPGLQAKILQVIEHKEFNPLGSAKTKKVDVQIIAATNADLEEKTAKGDFRKDLYFRLNEISIWVASLRERKEDIPFLVRHFIQKHAGLNRLEITGQDIETLSRHDWPGNVRELENTIKRWIVLGKHTSIPQLRTGVTLGSANAQFAASAAPTMASVAAPEAPASGRASKGDRDLTPDEIRTALEQNQWNRRKAAEVLGISYQGLRRKIEKFQLDTHR